jgi:TupA-like ATPgrasp
MKEFFRELRYKNDVTFWALYYFNKAKYYLTRDRFSDREFITKKFNQVQDYQLQLDNPRTLNEKLQWLKLNDRKEIYTVYADKYAVRKYMADNFGEDLLIPLLYHTTDYRDIRPENLPDTPFIIKANHGFGTYFIVRDKTKVNWKRLRTDCRLWLLTNYYYNEREWQYFNIKPRLVAEQLLVTKNGRIPNDYKLHCINGRVQFVYVSVDREGVNKRNIYDRAWNPLYFTWNRKGKDISNIRGEEVPPPASYERMLVIAEQIAQQFKYVRIDFYDVEGHLYFGEITQSHGGGFDSITPVELDYQFGAMITVP